MLSERSKQVRRVRTMYEIWKPIPNNEDYVISNYGRIKRVKKLGINGIVGRILKYSTTSNNEYIKVYLRSTGGQRRKFRVHRLVLETFVGPHKVGFEANHKDGNKQNNYVGNLEWVSHSENIKHAYDIRSLKRKLTWDQVCTIRSRSNENQVLLAREFGISPNTVYDILHNRRRVQSCQI